MCCTRNRKLFQSEFMTTTGRGPDNACGALLPVALATPVGESVGGRFGPFRQTGRPLEAASPGRP